MATGTRNRRARQLTAVAVLSLMLAALPATAWADHGHRSDRDGRGHSHGQVERGKAKVRVDAKVGRLEVKLHAGGRDDRAHGHKTATHQHKTAKHQRPDDRHAKHDRRDDKHRRNERHVKPEPASRATRDSNLGFAASLHVGPSVALDVQRRDAAPAKPQAGRSSQPSRLREQPRDRQQTREREQAATSRERAARQREQVARQREQAREQAEREREQAARNRERGERYMRDDRRARLELDRPIWGASTEAQREQERRDRELRRWLDTVGESRTTPDETTTVPDRSADTIDQPTQDDSGDRIAATSPTDPPAGAAGGAVPSPTPDEAAPFAAAATPGADLLAHQRGVVGRTFDASTEFLRETGRAVVAAIPPRARSFSIPLGLLVAIAGVLVLQRRFRPGTLPMSAASVPEQEGARERHRL